MFNPCRRGNMRRLAGALAACCVLATSAQGYTFGKVSPVSRLFSQRIASKHVGSRRWDLETSTQRARPGHCSCSITSSNRRRRSRFCARCPATRTTIELRMATTAAALSASRRVGKIFPANTVFFACDIQERFRDLIYNMPSVISTGRFLLDVSKALDVPCVVTEQYPKALLHTVSELNIGDGPDQNKVPVFEKKLFSMCTDEVLAHLNNLPNKPTDVVLFGLEAHVCVTQTCLDLLERGYGVHIVCDGVSSQTPYDRTVGLQRMQQVGAFLTTAEQVAFQLAVSADHPNFKAMSNLVKKRNAEGNAFSMMSTL